jgi:hypothetical protein
MKAVALRRERCCREDRNEPLRCERCYLEDRNEPLRRAYDVLNALAVLQPSAELSALVNVLFGIEDRAKLYYISGGKSGGDKPTPTPDGGTSDGGGSSDGGSSDGGSDDGGSDGDVTPVTPE